MIVARVMTWQTPCQCSILIISSTCALPEVAAVNGLVADRHFGMCIMYIPPPRFVRPRFRKVSVQRLRGA